MLRILAIIAIFYSSAASAQVWSDAVVDSIAVNTHMAFGSTSNYTGDFYPLQYNTIVLPAIKAIKIRHLRDSYAPTPPFVTQNIINQNHLIPDMLAYNGTRIGFDLVSFPPTGGATCIGDFLNTTVYAITNITWLPMGNIDSTEGLNEYNGSPTRCGNDPSFAAWSVLIPNWQTWLFGATKAFNSSIAVLGFSPLYHSTAQVLSDSTRVGDLTAVQDFGNQHSYPGGHYPSIAIQGLLTAELPMNGNKPTMATETGYHNDTLHVTCEQPGVSYQASGKYFSRLYFEYWNNGISRAYAYELLDDTSARKNPNQPPCGDINFGPEANYGLAYASGLLKPSGTVIANEISLLSDPGPTFTPIPLPVTLTLTSNGGAPPSQVHSLLMQNRRGHYFLALWQELDSYDTVNNIDVVVTPVPITVATPMLFSTINLYDPMKISKPIPYSSFSNQNTVNVSVTDSAIILEMIP